MHFWKKNREGRILQKIITEPGGGWRIFLFFHLIVLIFFKKRKKWLIFFNKGKKNARAF